MTKIKELLRAYGVVPRRARGQNFLVDQNILKKIVDAAQVKKTDVVVEVGAGCGVLTRELAARAKKVCAIEIDARLFEVLSKELEGRKNLELVKDDCLAVPNTRFGKKNGSYRVIANIPYSITARLIRKFLEECPQPSDMILLVQREVGERLCATPGHMSLLSLSAQYSSDPKILFRVSPRSFYPVPEVESVVISMKLKQVNDRSLTTKRLFSLAKAAFRAKRKQCAQTIAKECKIPLEEVRAGFQKCGISPRARAQELAVSDWLKLAHVFHFTAS